MSNVLHSSGIWILAAQLVACLGKSYSFVRGVCTISLLLCSGMGLWGGRKSMNPERKEGAITVL